jgi:hypothetical protein
VCEKSVGRARSRLRVVVTIPTALHGVDAVAAAHLRRTVLTTSRVVVRGRCCGGRVWMVMRLLLRCHRQVRLIGAGGRDEAGGGGRFATVDITRGEILLLVATGHRFASCNRPLLVVSFLALALLLALPLLREVIVQTSQVAPESRKTRRQRERKTVSKRARSLIMVHSQKHVIVCFLT